MSNIVNILLIAIPSVAILLLVATVLYKRLPRKLKADMFAAKWKELQAYCKDKATWPQALEEADKLLDLALRKRKYKGKTMGERMVSAQRVISNNDAMWFAHNLHKKIAGNPKLRLSEADVKSALIGFRGALKDIGALESPKKPTEEEEAKS